MAGTKIGGDKAARTNKKLHGKDFYARIGKIGGAMGTTGGFAQPLPCNCDVIEGVHLKRQCAGKKGGKISRPGSRAEKSR